MPSEYFNFWLIADNIKLGSKKPRTSENLIIKLKPCKTALTFCKFKIFKINFYQKWEMKAYRFKSFHPTNDFFFKYK